MGRPQGEESAPNSPLGTYARIGIYNGAEIPTGMPEEQRIAVPTEFDPEDEYRPEPEPEPLPPSWMDGRVRIGIHTSIAGSYLNALESARKLGCNALQIFSASPRMWQGRPARNSDGNAPALRERPEELRAAPLRI